MTKLIEKNTTIPTKAQQVFSTADDNQTAVTVHVLQGEREMASGNKSLGKFDLSDIPPAPRGMPQIEVAFDIDANGILNVSAKDKATGKEQSIVIKASSGLSDEEVEKMVKDAEAHAEEDRKRREDAETRNQAESLVHQTEKVISDNDEQLPEESKEKVRTAINEVNEALKGEDVSEIKSAVEKLATESQSLGQALYADSGGGQTGDGSGAEGASADSTGSEQSGSADEEEVVDAEVVDDEDQKK